MIRKKFINGEIYHVFNKSIANYEIFKSDSNCKRFLQTLHYYNSGFTKISLSGYLSANKEYVFESLLIPKNDAVIKFLAYCIMPDHYHLLIRVLNQMSIYKYLNNIAGSYTRYFNLRLKRKGPLWQSAYKMVRIKTNEQLLHINRYIHLNPTTNNLVKNPLDWQYSSYNEYINKDMILNNIITEISIKSKNSFKKFIEDQIDYQKKLKIIKKLILK